MSLDLAEPGTASRVRRLAEVTGFVAAWMALGLTFRLESNAYLLLGIPLTIVFQLVVRRAPIRALWVRAGPHFRLGALGLVIAAVLAVVPGYLLVTATREGAPRVVLGVLLAAMGGAVAAAYAFQSFRRSTGWALLMCLATAGLIAVVLMRFGVAGAAAPPRPPLAMLEIGIRSFLLYLPIVFVLEEVAFRGALDAHVHHPGEPRGILSAIAVSALWGIWHYPIAPPAAALQTIGQLLLLHVPVGVFLSLYWRRSGNLVVPGATHAFMDSVRNATLASSI
jgi:membrane protease YdiL (CAAX protease family)